MPCFYIYNTFNCHFKPNQKCQRDMNDPVCILWFICLNLNNYEYISHYTFNFLKVLPHLCSSATKLLQIRMHCQIWLPATMKYRVIHVSLTFLIWLKMTLKCIVDLKARHFYSPEDPPFDMKHQLMSADSLPVVKIDLSRKVNFHYFFFHFYTIWEFFPKPFFLLVWAWTSNFSSFMMHESHFLGFWESLFLNISNFDETIKNWQNWQIGTSF